MALFDRYVARVGRALGANRLWVAATGFFNVGDVQGGADGLDITGMQLRGVLGGLATRTSYTLTSAIQTVSVIPAQYGIVEFNYISATTSCKLPLAYSGAFLTLRFDMCLSTVSVLPGSNAGGSVQSIVCGVSDISMILASVNGASNVWIALTSPTTGIWAVVNSGGVTTLPQRSS